jgi:hypothetical protein
MSDILNKEIGILIFLAYTVSLFIILHSSVTVTAINLTW